VNCWNLFQRWNWSHRMNKGPIWGPIIRKVQGGEAEMKISTTPAVPSSAMTKGV
jgi:hypothetical protein